MQFPNVCQVSMKYLDFNLSCISFLSREILRVMEILKMDIANFTIQQIRPFIQQQSVDYERKKFLEFLKAQQGKYIFARGYFWS